MTAVPRSLVALAASVLLLAPLPRTLSAQTPPIRLRLIGYFTPMSVDSVATSPFAIQATREATYKAATAVLTELKIPVTTLDPLFRVLGNGSARAIRKIGRERLSTYLNCGAGITGAHADDWRVTMALFIWVEPVTATESQIRIGLLAGAQDVQGVAKDPVSCASTGLLESFLSAEIRKRSAMF